eukprot:scaffold52252_cov35-Cyclotella_meneghiniana.AAC.8
MKSAEPEFQEIIATDVVPHFRDYHSDVTIEAKYNRVYKANIPPGLKKCRMPDCSLELSYKGKNIITVFAECDEWYHNKCSYNVEDENDKNQWETHAALHNGAKKVIHFRVGTPTRRRLGAYEADNLGRVMKEGITLLIERWRSGHTEIEKKMTYLGYPENNSFIEATKRTFFFDKVTVLPEW